jgi:hypothetical protein
MPPIATLLAALWLLSPALHALPDPILSSNPLFLVNASLSADSNDVTLLSVTVSLGVVVDGSFSRCSATYSHPNGSSPIHCSLSPTSYASNRTSLAGRFVIPAASPTGVWRLNTLICIEPSYMARSASFSSFSPLIANRSSIVLQGSGDFRPPVLSAIQFQQSTFLTLPTPAVVRVRDTHIGCAFSPKSSH